MSTDLLSMVETTTLDADGIADRLATIHANMLSRSQTLDAANFTQIHPADLRLLYAEYDDVFFAGQIKGTLGSIPLAFRLSRRMTSSGGVTTKFTERATGDQRYEIAISTALLYGCFGDDDHRPIVASGITCHDRLSALQRVMEHELVHLIENLLWDKSSCSRPRFHSITRRFFGHTENTHKMITPREKAMAKFGIRPGSKVRFRFEGSEHRGIVNRINKRATVLVEDQGGTPYRDGKCYAKFYVPLQMLEVLE